MALMGLMEMRMMLPIGSNPHDQRPQGGFTPMRRLNVGMKSGSPRGVTPRTKPSISVVLFSGLGFTLVELLMVILIMSVVVGLSVPRFGRTFGHLQLQVFAYDVAKLFTYASKRAIAREEILRIYFDTEGKRYWLARAQGAAPKWEFERVAGKFGRINPVPDAISLDPSAGEVTFFPDGRADRFEMLIFDNSQDGYRLVTDFWTGHVKLLETNGK